MTRPRMRRSSIVVVAAGAALLIAGCRSPKSEAKAAWQRGYALLYELLSREVNLDKILWVKSESDAVDRLVDEIVELCAGAKAKLEGFREKDATLDFESQPLPEIEVETRADIESETAKELLGASGADFEAKLLLTQLRALRYGASLARVIAEHETDEARKSFLEDFAGHSTRVRKKVYVLLLERITAKE